jgi:hypothetical protein
VPTEVPTEKDARAAPRRPHNTTSKIVACSETQ